MLRAVQRFITRRLAGTGLLPQGVRVYAVGDVHGRFDLLRGKLQAIDAHLARYPITRAIQVFLGDYVDRGPDSALVLECLARPATRGMERVCLRGNHEEAMSRFLARPAHLSLWAPLGAEATLASYGITRQMLQSAGDPASIQAEFRRRVPERHRTFLAGLPVIHRIGGYAFVHAGVRPGVPLDRQSTEDLLWIRDEFLDYPGYMGAMVVHGHTPVKDVEFRSNRINVDTGAYHTGRLSCLVLEGDRAELL